MMKRFRHSVAQGNPCVFLIQIVRLPLIVLLMGPLAGTSATAADPGQQPEPGGYFYRVFFGVLAHDVGGLWSGTRKEDGMDINAEIVLRRPGISLFSGTVRPNLGVSLNTHGDTSKLYGGVLWEINTKRGVFFASGLGAAVHNGKRHTDNSDKKSLGTRILFRIPIELGYQITAHHSLSIMFDHVSNAGLASSNEGLDTIGIRYGYLF